jgi:signal transduction histidine kinase
MARGTKDFLLKQNYQVIYAIILILLIPTAIILNTIWSVKSFQKNIDVGLQRQALLIGQLFNTAVYKEVGDETDLQRRLQGIKEANLDLNNFDILIKEGDKFKIVASFDDWKIGQSSEDLNYVIAWHQKTALATLVSGLSGTDSAQDRFWEVTIPLIGKSGTQEALLSLQMSLATMDNLAQDTLTKSYLLLIITVLIVILLLALNTRLFEHAILFKKLKEVDQMKDEFISIASHELRTPITTLKGFVSMTLEGDYGQLNAQGTKGFKIMESSINRLNNLVEDLLNVSRIEQKRLVIKKEPTALPEILASLVAEFDFRIKEKGLKFKLEVAKNLPRVLADPDKLKQILVNLIGNSIKYTAKGEIELTAKPSSEKFITLTVKDTGFGMTAQERANLFDKFYRVQNEETKSIVGTGLGLWITKQLVEMMGGQIFVDSIKHVGSQFYFTVPIYHEVTPKTIINK